MENIKFQVGNMTKDPRQMTQEELRNWQKKCAENARDYLFAINQPLVYRDHRGIMVAEYKNGQILPVE